MARVFVDGRVHVRQSRCPTCIFRSGNLCHLTEGRVEDMVEKAVAQDGSISCHEHLYNGAKIEPVCRGFFDLHAPPTLQIAERLGFITWVS